MRQLEVSQLRKPDGARIVAIRIKVCNFKKGGVKKCQEVMEPVLKEKDRERGEEWGAVEEKALRDQRVCQARVRALVKERVRVKAAERIKAREAVLAKVTNK